MPYRRRSASGGVTAAIVLIGLFLLFVFGFNMITFFVFLAIAIFIGSLGTLNPRRIYGGLIGAMWMIILALFFATHFQFWPLLLIGIALSALMRAFARPIIASLLGLGLFNMFNKQQQQPPYYQPPQQPYTPPGNQYYQPPQQPYQPYEQGYQAPTPPAGTYQEGGQQYPYPSQSAQDYEQPQAQYPQQMPPQQ